MAAHELRPYQQQAKTAIHAEWDKGHSKTLVVLPTGCGKTIVFAQVAADQVRAGQRVLILAHRGELLEQAADKIKATTGLAAASAVPIPALARGGVIPPNREFLAVLGDQRSGTNIEAPLDTIVQAFRTALGEFSGGGDGQPINIYIGEELLDSVIAGSQSRRMLRSGGR